MGEGIFLVGCRSISLHMAQSCNCNLIPVSTSGTREWGRVISEHRALNTTGCIFQTSNGNNNNKHEKSNQVGQVIALRAGIHAWHMPDSDFNHSEAAEADGLYCCGVPSILV